MTSPISLPEKELIKDALNKCNRAILWLVIVSFAINLLMLVQSIYMLQVFVRVLPGHRNETLIYLTIITVFAIAGLSTLLWVRSRFLQAIGQWLQSEIAPEAILRCPDQIIKGINYGVQSQTDLNQIISFISSPGMTAILDIPWIPVYLIFLFFLHFLLGIITVVGAIVLIVFAVLNEWTVRVSFQNANRKFVKNQILLDTTLRNAETIQAMGMMDAILKNWSGRQAEAKEELAPAQLKASYFQYLTHFVRLFLQIFIMGVGAFLVLEGKINAGAMIAASIVLSRALAPLENGIAFWQGLSNARTAYSRLVVHLRHKTRTADTYLEKIPTGRVDVQELYYAIPATLQTVSKSILEGVSFRLEPGEMLILIGPSGSGKTTLVRALTGIYQPTRGSVRLDGAATFLWNRRDFGKYVGYLPQTIELFDGTVAQNIARMDLGENKDRVVEAAVKANVHASILRLPGGYDTDIGTYGAALSGGMRQRIAFARALYGEPCLIVLDEPNSNLDDEGLAALMKALQTLKQEKRTVVLITHHPYLLGLADKILMLQQGRVALYGPARQVLEKLKEMAMAQPPQPPPSPNPKEQEKSNHG